MKNITTKTILSPFAIALLIATTGCALDQDDAPDTEIDDAQSNNYVIADDAGVQFTDAKQAGDWNYAAADDEPKRDQTAKIPSDQQPEGGEKEGGEKEGGENEGGQNEGGQNEGGEGSLPSGPTELDKNLIVQLADVITFVSPLRVAGDLTQAQFVDLDLGGVLTTSTQNIDSCRVVNFDRETKVLDISFDCAHLGDNAPTGNIECQLSYPTPGEAALACRLEVESVLGTTQAKVNVKYEFGADAAHITLRATAPQTLTNHIEVEAKHDIHGISSFNDDGTTQEHASRLFVTTDNNLYSVATANVFRTSNDCRPATGQYTIDTFNPLQEDDSDRFVFSGIAGSWSATDGADTAIQIPICN